MEAPRILLASGSPRRRLLLEEAGFQVESRVPVIDDAEVRFSETIPSRIVISLAWFKASQIDWKGDEALAMVAADTVCDLDGDVLGKPHSKEEAEVMLRGMFEREHVTRTGVCVRSADSRFLFDDASIVRMGTPQEEDLRSYLDSEEWRGKAGGYNLADRIHAGWPIECDGDPTTVMGLPMRRLVPILNEMGEHDGA